MSGNPDHTSRPHVAEPNTLYTNGTKGVNTVNTPPTPPTWRKSSYSGQYSDNCIECAIAAPASGVAPNPPDVIVAVRDSKDPTGPVLHFHADAWRAFMRSIKSDGLRPNHYRNG